MTGGWPANYLLPGRGRLVPLSLQNCLINEALDLLDSKQWLNTIINIQSLSLFNINKQVLSPQMSSSCQKIWRLGALWQSSETLDWEIQLKEVPWEMSSELRDDPKLDSSLLSCVEDRRSCIIDFQSFNLLITSSVLTSKIRIKRIFKIN